MEPSEFDPYLKWLGIRSAKHPPNHYRLLGLNLFESDPDVISHAADARIAHIRNFLTGPHRPLAEKILQELKTAKAALLDPAQKALYDQQLQAELAKAPEAVSATGSSGPPPLPGQHPAGPTGPWANPVEEPTTCSGMQTPPPVQLLKSRLFWLSSTVLLLLVVTVGTIAGYLSKRSGSADQLAQTDQADLQQSISSPQEGSPADTDHPPKPDASSPISGKPEGKNSLDPSAGQELLEASAGEKPAAGPEVAPSGSEKPGLAPSTPDGFSTGSAGTSGQMPDSDSAKPELSKSEKPELPPKEASAGAGLESAGKSQEKEQPLFPEESSKHPSSPATSSEKQENASEKSETPSSKEEASSGEQTATGKEKPSSQAETQRQPVPSAEEQKRAEATVRDLFKKELGEAKLPPQKLALADKLFQEALATKDDPAAAYVLFGLASGLAAGAGDLTTSIEMIEAAAGRFEMNTVSMKLEVLNKALPALRTAPQPAMLAYELADLALSLMEEAILADQIPEAAEAYKLASSIVKRSGDNDLIQEVVSRNHCLQVFQKQYEAFRAAEKQLAANPDDPAAHGTLGRWQCFLKGLWEKGLEYLAKGQPAELASLAKADLAAPEDPKEQFLLAERWLKYADSESDEAKGHIQLRAAYWYGQALPGLSGLEKITAQRQLEKLPTTPPLFTPRNRGEVVPGNVALEVAGAQVSGTNTTGAYLIDGRNAESDLAAAYSPASWTVFLPKTYRLREIRLLLPQNLRGRPRNYGYLIAVSKDGKRFVPLVDRSKGQWMGWQVLRFPARPVRAIQLIGFREPNDREFYAAELEAYCIPPKYPPGTPSEPPPGVASEGPPFGPRKKHRPGEENQPPPAHEKKPRDKPPAKGAD